MLGPLHFIDYITDLDTRSNIIFNKFVDDKVRRVSQSDQKIWFLKDELDRLYD